MQRSHGGEENKDPPSFLAGANVPYDQCPGEGSLHRRQGDNDFEKDKSSKVSKLNAKSRDSSIDIEEETIKK